MQTIQSGKSGPAIIAEALVKLQALNGKISDVRDKSRQSKEVYALYAKDVRGNKEFEDMPLMAATSADNVGTLAGILVALKALDFLKFEFPVLGQITTDFSDSPGEFNQTSRTRVVTAPALMTYNPEIGADGRPVGWVIATQPVATDVPVTIDNHKGVEICFDEEAIGGTNRRLFEENAGPAAYTLGKAIADSIYARITTGNFTTNAAFTESSIDFGRRTFSKAGRILTAQGVPFQGRIALINSIYNEILEQDTTITALGVHQKPEIITQSQLPPISRFQPFEIPNLPTTGNLGAFFGHKSSLVIKTRVPIDYTTILPGASANNGSVMVVTNPDLGVSVMLVQYVSHQGGYGAWRMAGMWGTAVGNEKTGQIVRTANV